MKCKNCGTELQSGLNFCPGCGRKVEIEEPEKVQIKTISLKCTNCNGTLTVNSDNTELNCPYCGNKTLIIENDAVAIERIKNDTYKAVELERIKSENDKDERKDKNNKTEKFKKSKFFKLLIGAFLLSIVLAFVFFKQGNVLTGIMMVGQGALFAAAWCFGMNFFSTKWHYLYIPLMILGVILYVPMFSSLGKVKNTSHATEIKWSILFLGDKIPETNSKLAEIHDNTARALYIEIYNVDQNDYYEYIANCKNLGYNISVMENSMAFEAYNQDGYGVDLLYSSYKNTLDIRVTSPTEVTDLNWSTHNISAILPEPNSKLGAFGLENDKECNFVVSKITTDDFKNYCNACKDKGFIVDSKDNTTTYEAFDSNGNRVWIHHNSGNNEMSINFDYAKKSTEITWPTVGLGSLLPVPKSLSGRLGSSYSWVYSVYLENMTVEDLKAYAQECIKVGFDKEISEYEKSFYAYYSKDDEIKLSITYEGFNTVEIEVSGSMNADYSKYKKNDTSSGTQQVTNKDQATEKPTEKATEKATEAPTKKSGISKEFKEAMDSYEAYFNEYVDATNKYMNNTSDLLAFAEYTKLLAKYADTMKKLDAIKSDSLTDEELAYYTQVNARIAAKLATVS